MFGSAITVPGIDHQIRATGGALAGIAADRDRLSHLLRGLAAELDGLDRRLSDVNWLRAQSTGPIDDETPCERTALGQLSHLDVVLSDLRGHDTIPTPRVGTCPHCGYPSLGSGWCAYCRPHLLTH